MLGLVPTSLLIRLGLAAAAVAGAVAAYAWWAGELREEGRAEVRAEMAAAVAAQEARNRELQRAAEKRYVVAAEIRERVIVETIVEVRHAAQDLAACPVPDRARRLLNDAAACARDGSAAACGADQPVRNAD